MVTKIYNWSALNTKFLRLIKWKFQISQLHCYYSNLLLNNWKESHWNRTCCQKINLQLSRDARTSNEKKKCGWIISEPLHYEYWRLNLRAAMAFPRPEYSTSRILTTKKLFFTLFRNSCVGVVVAVIHVDSSCMMDHSFQVLLQNF